MAHLLATARGLSLLACAAMGGCYERVVGARGAGADQYDISDPYQESGPVDRWFWGDEKTPEEYKSKPGIRTH